MLFVGMLVCAHSCVRMDVGGVGCSSDILGFPEIKCLRYERQTCFSCYSSKASRDHHDRMPSGPASVAIAPPNSLLDKRKESNQTPSGSGSSNDGERKNLGICIRGLPVRSSGMYYLLY